MLNDSDVAGTTATDALNELARTRPNYTVPYRGAVARLNATKTSLSFPYLVVFDRVDRDTDGFWDAGAPTRFTVPAGISKVRLKAGVRFEDSANAGVNQLQIFKDGATLQASPYDSTRVYSSGSSVNVANVCTTVIDVEEGNYFEVSVSSSVTGVNEVNASAFTYFEIEVIETTNVIGFARNYTAPYRGATLQRSSAATSISSPYIVSWQTVQYDSDSAWDAGSPTKAIAGS